MNDPRGSRGRLGRGPVNWPAAIGVAIGLVIGGQIGYFAWGVPGLLIGDVAGAVAGWLIGDRIARSRRA